MIEQVRGPPLAEVLCADVLAIDGVEGLIVQPDERPTEPIAVRGGESTAVLELGGHSRVDLGHSGVVRRGAELALP